MNVMGRATPAWFTKMAPVVLLTVACGSVVSSASGIQLGTKTTVDPAVLGTTQVPSKDLPVLRVGALETTTLDPSYITTDSEREIASLLFEPLVVLDETSQPGPGAALSWSTDDNIEWTFKLDPEGRFHNGEAVTAQSFIDGFSFLADPENLVPNAYLGVDAGIVGFADVALGDAEDIAGLAAPDDHTLVITLNKPNALLPSLLANESFAPRSRASLDAESSQSTRPNGNGPFEIVGEWDEESAVIVQPVGDTGHIVRFELFDSVDAMFRDRTLDISHVPDRERDQVRFEAGDAMVERTSGTYNYLAFPIQTAPFDDPQVRRALSLAIDRERLVDDVFSGAKLPAVGFAPAGSPGSRPRDCDSCVFDPEEARRLLGDTEIFGDKPIELAFNTGRDHEVWMQAIGAQWSEVFGVEVRFKPIGPAPYFEAIQTGAHTGPYRLKWSTDFAHAMSFLEPLFVDEDEATVGYDNEKITTIAQSFLQLADPYDENGSKLVAQMTDLLDEDMPIIPVYAEVGARVTSDAVSELHLNLDGSAQLRNVILTP